MSDFPREVWVRPIQGPGYIDFKLALKPETADARRYVLAPVSPSDEIEDNPASPAGPANSGD